MRLTAALQPVSVFGAESPFFIAAAGKGAVIPAFWLGPGEKERIQIMRKTRFITEAAIIAALYAVLTIVIPGGSGQIQIRVAEALTILPFFTPAAIPGLFVGCLTANLLVGFGPYDIVIGSLTTLFAAFFTWKMPKKLLAPLPPVILNAIGVAVILKLAANIPMPATMGFVAIGEIVACYVLGYPLLLLLEKQKYRIFGSRQPGA